MKKRYIFIERRNNSGALFFLCVKHMREISLITHELFFYQLEKLKHFTRDDFEFIPLINHPIHGTITKIVLAENLFNRFYAALPNNRRAVYFKDEYIKFLLIDVFNDKEEYKKRIENYSNSLIYLLEHYKNARIKQEFDNLEWGLDGTVD